MTITSNTDDPEVINVIKYFTEKRGSYGELSISKDDLGYIWVAVSNASVHTRDLNENFLENYSVAIVKYRNERLRIQLSPE